MSTRSRHRNIARTSTVVALPAIVVATLVGAAAAVGVPSATTGAVTSVKPTSVVVSGTVNPNGLSTLWYFEFGPSTSYGSKSAENSAGAGTGDVAVSATLAGLNVASGYHYRLVATSSAGTTDGADGVVSTTAVPNSVTQPTSALTATSATLNGIVNAEGQATTWYFEYGTTTAYGTKTPAKSLAAGPGNTNVSVAIAGLSPKTRYDYRLVATSSAGIDNGSNLAFTTGLSITLNANIFDVVWASDALGCGREQAERGGCHRPYRAVHSVELHRECAGDDGFRWQVELPHATVGPNRV